MPTKHLLIKGKVQGVFYRVSAKDMAEKIGVTGWIKNTEAGDVEAMVTGTTFQLTDFIDWCWKGPSKALVTSVAVIDTEEKNFAAFSVIRG